MTPIVLLLSLLPVAGCFGSSAPSRSHFVLHGITATQAPGAPFAGLVRVRNLDAANIYEKSQIVVRKNPYELQYSEDNVWAVKPSNMVSDVIARALADSGRFTSVVRQLGEVRPDYILGGDLRAIEVYDSGDIWFAHVSLALHLTRVKNGETIYSFTFDQRRRLPERSFAQAARAISELLSIAIEKLIVELDGVDAPRVEVDEDEALRAPDASAAEPA
ncbi:MAG: ABC-type transport auxiliary lipoprotein family protein, partial [Myxococcota bacterium]